MNLLAEQLDYQEISHSVELLDLTLDPLIHENLKENRNKAENILKKNKNLLIDGQFDKVPLPINVLGTAELAVQADNPFLEEVYSRALYKDSLRLISETMRKKSWEYYPPIYQLYDQDTKDFRVGRIALGQVVENGLSPIADQEEQQIRIAEYLEHQNSLFVHEQIKDSDLKVSLITIKECPDYVIRDFNRDNLAPHGGYVPQIKKLVIQRAIIDKQGQSIEQFALSGEYIDHDLIIQSLIEIGAIPSDSQLSKLELRNKQFIGQSEEDELLDLVRILDQKASLKSNKDIFMGEPVDSQNDRHYLGVREQAETRQNSYNQMALKVSNYLKELALKQTDKRLAEFLLSDFLKKILFKEVIDNPNKAKIVFDDKTSNKIKSAQELLYRGQLDQYLQAKKEIFQTAPSPSFCGAGSCGLVAVMSDSSEAKKVSSLGLKGEIIKDTVRHCPNCGQRAVFYDKKGSKACSSCKSSEIK